MAKNRNTTENQGELAFTFQRAKRASAKMISNANRTVMARVAAP